MKTGLTTKARRPRSGFWTPVALRALRGFVVYILLVSPMVSAQDLLTDDAKVQKLATGMHFTEGPVWSDADGGYLIFSDIPANELKKWTAKDGVTTFRKPSRNTNGNTRDREGNLISCEHSA